MRRRRVPDEVLMRWFRFEPVSEPLVAEASMEAAAGILATDPA
jgi:hypothetical protein